MQLYGPFPVYVYVNGVLSDQLAEGAHFTTTTAEYEQNKGLLSPYRVYPTNPLQFIMAGDSRENGYENTVPLCFPDQQTADALIESLSQQVTTLES